MRTVPGSYRSVYPQPLAQRPCDLAADLAAVPRARTGRIDQTDRTTTVSPRATVRPDGNRHPARPHPAHFRPREAGGDLWEASATLPRSPYLCPKRPSSRAIRAVATSTSLIPERRPTLANR